MLPSQNFNFSWKMSVCQNLYCLIFSINFRHTLFFRFCQTLFFGISFLIALQGCSVWIHIVSIRPHIIQSSGTKKVFYFQINIIILIYTYEMSFCLSVCPPFFFSNFWGFWVIFWKFFGFWGIILAFSVCLRNSNLWRGLRLTKLAQRAWN